MFATPAISVWGIMCVFSVMFFWYFYWDAKLTLVCMFGCLSLPNAPKPRPLGPVCPSDRFSKWFPHSRWSRSRIKKIIIINHCVDLLSTTFQSSFNMWPLRGTVLKRKKKLENEEHNISFFPPHLWLLWDSLYIGHLILVIALLEA